jgi:hypothetical protein
MLDLLPARALATLAALTALAAAAQPATAPVAVPAAAAPAGWHSAFDGYRPFSDEQITPWKQANETVQNIGGWRAYAREASESKAAGAAAPGSAAPADPHAGHHAEPQ